jgi:hypothetical protein
MICLNFHLIERYGDSIDVEIDDDEEEDKDDNYEQYEHISRQVVTLNMTLCV